MRKLCLAWGLAGVLASLLALSPCHALAQKSLLDDLKIDAQDAADPRELMIVSARFSADKKNGTGQLSITARIAEDWHTYSITQAKDGPLRTQIKLNESGDYKLAGDFRASPQPKKHIDKDLYSVPLEEHAGTVTWTAPIELASGVDPAELKISGKVGSQLCREGTCLFPTDFPFTAALDGTEASAATKPSAGEQPAAKPSGSREPADAGVYKADGITFRGYVSPRMVVPGGKFKLVITAEPAEGWHIYELSDKPPASLIGARPTLLVLTETAGLKDGPALPSEPPVNDPISSVRIHEQPVSWTVELTAPRSAKRGPLTLAGLLGYQICTDQNCRNPAALGFEAEVALGAQTVDGQVPLKFDPKRKYNEVQKLVKNAAAGANRGPPAPTRGDKTSSLNFENLKPAGFSGEPSSLLRMIGLGFLGGLILNVMPCVLPVIGLKILSFFEQSGHSRGRAFLLNLWYSFGMLTVFMVLATIPVVLRLGFNQEFGWGQQFSYAGFNITLAALVFAMALSFLGVWEIPIPGFVGGSAANQLAAKEGFSGAFAKGAITTVLATPCSGPFLGTALGFALAQPPLVIYLMFASIGLGMASPYLLIGMFPQALRWLPKPGAWMDTFKQVMGFVLLGTVVYLMSLVRVQFFIPTLALLFGIWAGCWWIGRTPLYAELPAKLRSWAGGAIVAALVGITAFQWLGPEMQARFQRAVDQQIAAIGSQARKTERAAPVDLPDHLPWQPFSTERLVALTSEGKTVMVDFTADWCVTCKTLEKFVLNTAETKKMVVANGIITLVADMTEFPEEESALLERLTGGRLVPVLAIFPAGRPNEPIVLNDAYTQGLLFQKLKEAGPSKKGEVMELSAR